MKPRQIKGAKVFAVITIPVFYFFFYAGSLCSGKNWIMQFPNAILNTTDEMAKTLIPHSFGAPAFGGALFGVLLLWIIYTCIYLMPRPEREGEEHGSARWASTKEMQKFKNNENPDLNVVFSQNSGLMTVTPKNISLQDRINYERNRNIAIIGGSGSGKTRYYVKPNLMQLHGNYFVTDPKGTVIEECGHLFEDNGYDIKCLNVISAVTIDENCNLLDDDDPDCVNAMKSSMHYNPLYYVKTEEQILAFVNCLIKNTKGGDGQGGNADPFWEDSEKLLYMALLSFLKDWMPPECFTLPNLVDWLELAKVKEEDEDFESPLDSIFKQIETGLRYVRVDSEDGRRWIRNHSKNKGKGGKGGKETRVVDGFIQLDNVAGPAQGVGQLPPREGFIDIPSKFVKYLPNGEVEPVSHFNPETGEYEGRPDDYCVKRYNDFKQAAGKTLKSIIISCNVRLLPISIPLIADILNGAKDQNGEPTGRCEMELHKLGDPNHKQVIFAVMSDTNDTYFFIIALLVYQLMDLLCNKAFTNFKGKLPTPVHFILDEFANLGVLPDFNRTIAITRSRNIGVSMILQTPFQLEQNYSKEVAKVIIDNCDTMVYLGGGSDGADVSTCKEISARLGKETIHVRTYGSNRGQQASTNINNQIQARELMTSDEVAMLPRGEQLVLVKNTYPYRDKKYDLATHKRYKLIDPEAHNDNTCKYKENFNFVEYRDKYRKRRFVHEMAQNDVPFYGATKEDVEEIYGNREGEEKNTELRQSA